MPLDLGSLNENQRTAVQFNDGALLVLAAPGSGKTQVLTLRIARILEENEEASVLALTFAERAASEMRRRVDELLGRRAVRAHLCTFHSFASDLLRQHGSHIGLKPDFNLITQYEDRLAILGPLAAKLKDEGHDVPADLKNLLVLVDRLFAESYQGESAAPWLARPTPSWLPLLYASYCDSLLADNRLDFGSLLVFAQKLLRVKPAVARIVRLSWTHVCVDEFQDTNKAQYDLLKLILPETGPNLFVVGDDDQIIYQWNGASPERLQNLLSDFDMKLVQLPENYRCPAEIIELANLLIAHNRFRIPGKGKVAAKRPASEAHNIIRLESFGEVGEELDFVAEDFIKRSIAPAECVVLARNHRLLDAAADAFHRAGVATHLPRRKTDFETPVIRVLFEALRLANARHDREILRRLCIAWEAYTEKELEVEDVVAAASLVGGDFLRAWAETARLGIPAGKAADLAEKILASLVERLEFPQVVEEFLAVGRSPWEDSEDRELNDELARWREIHQDIVHERGQKDLTLDLYLQQTALAPKTKQAPLNAVRCMTVYNAKGLEFGHVYLIGMAQEIFPSFQALKRGPGSRELEEERRNCFVALTRVQETLTLTRASRYYGYNKMPSQFLKEMGLEK